MQLAGRRTADAPTKTVPRQHHRREHFRDPARCCIRYCQCIPAALRSPPESQALTHLGCSPSPLQAYQSLTLGILRQTIPRFHRNANVLHGTPAGAGGCQASSTPHLEFTHKDRRYLTDAWDGPAVRIGTWSTSLPAPDPQRCVIVRPNWTSTASKLDIHDTHCTQCVHPTHTGNQMHARFSDGLIQQCALVGAANLAGPFCSSWISVTCWPAELSRNTRTSALAKSALPLQTPPTRPGAQQCPARNA